MKQIEFTMDKIFTFGSKDAEHRFIIRNHFLKNNSNFEGFKFQKDETFEVVIDIEHTKSSIDIDNVPKVIIDAFSASQIKRDLENWHTYIDKGDLSAAKQKEYENIVKLEEKHPLSAYKKLGLYQDDTIEYIGKLTCSAKVVKKDGPSVHVIIRATETL